MCCLVSPATGAGQPIVAASTLTIAGGFANGCATTVLIDGAPALTLTLPGAVGSGQQATIAGVPLPATVASGAHSLQVVQQIPTGEAAQPLSSSGSNLAGFVLQPSVVSTSVAAATRDLTVNVAPAVAAHQTVVALLNPMPPAAGPASYQLTTGAAQADGATAFVFATKGSPGGDLPSGTYLLRVQIDGVASPLAFTPPPRSGAATGPTGFTGPTVVLA
jgi:hypothetical protein